MSDREQQDQDFVLSFIEKRRDEAISDATRQPVSIDELTRVTRWFASRAAELDAAGTPVRPGTEEEDEVIRALSQASLAVRHHVYGNRVFFRGLIEFTNYCTNGCYYCGINGTRRDVKRYRLTREEILACCREGERLGYNSYVLQGGEDKFFDDDTMCDIIRSIRAEFPKAAITLSIGEKTEETYRRYIEAGADRYLLRHETASEEHYNKLHPSSMRLSERKECLYALRKIGFQVGAGYMVGSPYQTPETLAEDLLFLRELEPHMIGIGPFLPSAGTKFANEAPGSVRMTLIMIALTRLMVPKALMPSTTALGTADKTGREKGFSYGANVVMPNLSPMGVREDYALYDDKICTGDDAASCQQCLNGRIIRSGNQPDYERGDHIDFEVTE